MSSVRRRGERRENDWKCALTMYEEVSMTEEAKRVCRKDGEIVVFKTLVFDISLSSSDDTQAIEILLGYNLCSIKLSITC